MEKYKYYNYEFRILEKLLTDVGIILYREDGEIRNALDVFEEVKIANIDDSLRGEILKQVEVATESLQ